MSTLQEYLDARIRPLRIRDDLEKPFLVWQTTKNLNVYVNGYWEGTQTGIHRLRWLSEHRSIPKGMFVCHVCDVRACCELSHLFLGTHQDNVDDKVNKNRQARICGTRNASAKLAIEQIQRIRELKGTMSCQDIALQFCVSKSTISRILQGKLWAEV